MTFKMYTDGGARGNPGPAAAGIVICDVSGKVVSRYKKYLGNRTNNEAEYGALIIGLTLAKEQGIEDIECFMDSELLVKQLQGKYKVKSGNLKNLYQKVKDLEKDLGRVTYTHIPREDNSAADKLVNEALDDAEEK